MQNKDDENKGKKRKLDDACDLFEGVEETKDVAPTELLETLDQRLP
jgi:hypothetical protein